MSISHEVKSWKTLSLIPNTGTKPCVENKQNKPRWTWSLSRQKHGGRMEPSPCKLFSKFKLAVNIHVYGPDVHLKLPRCRRVSVVVWEQTNWDLESELHLTTLSALNSKSGSSNTQKRIDNSWPLLIQYGTYWPQLPVHNVRCRSCPGNTSYKLTT